MYVVRTPTRPNQGLHTKITLDGILRHADQFSAEMFQNQDFKKWIF